MGVLREVETFSGQSPHCGGRIESQRLGWDGGGERGRGTGMGWGWGVGIGGRKERGGMGEG